MKKIIGIALCLCLIPFSAHAAVTISEIMYDLPGSDAGREWIEITNQGPETVDLSAFTFFEAKAAHKIKLFKGKVILVPGDVAVVTEDSATFLADNASFGGVLFDSSWSSFSNDGETLEIRDKGGKILDQISYTKALGAAGDGMALERSGATFVAKVATPGIRPKSLGVTVPLPKPVSVQESPEPVKVEAIKASQQKSRTTATEKTPEISNEAAAVSAEPAAGIEAEGTSDGNFWLYLLALGGILGVVCVGVLLMRPEGASQPVSLVLGLGRTKEADSYTIIE